MDLCAGVVPRRLHRWSVHRFSPALAVYVLCTFVHIGLFAYPHSVTSNLADPSGGRSAERAESAQRGLEQAQPRPRRALLSTAKSPASSATKKRAISKQITISADELKQVQKALAMCNVNQPMAVNPTDKAIKAKFGKLFTYSQTLLNKMLSTRQVHDAKWKSMHKDAAKTMAERVAEQRQHVARNAKDDNVLELTEAYHNNLLREMGADVQRLYQRRIDTFPVGTPAADDATLDSERFKRMNDAAPSIPQHIAMNDVSAGHHHGRAGYELPASAAVVYDPDAHPFPPVLPSKGQRYYEKLARQAQSGR